MASTFDTYIFMALQTGNSKIGQTAAAGLFQSVCCCITVLITNAIVSKIDPDKCHHLRKGGRKRCQHMSEKRAVRKAEKRIEREEAEGRV